MPAAREAAELCLGMNDKLSIDSPGPLSLVQFLFRFLVIEITKANTCTVFITVND